MAKVVLSRNMIEKIIKEEVLAAKQRFIKESLDSSISNIEIEELLRTYFHKTGGVPAEVKKLSMLFPILEKLGLDHIVDAFLESKKTGKADMSILDPVKAAIASIEGDTFN